MPRPGEDLFRAWVLLVAVSALAVHAETGLPENPEASYEGPSLTSPFDLEFEPLGEDILLAHRPGVPRYPVVGNAVIIFNADDVIVVDGGGSRTVVEQIIAKIEERTENSVSHLIVTHWHADHTVGLDRYAERYPELRVVAHPFTRERIENALLERVERFGADARSLLESARERLEAASEPGAPPLAAAERTYYEQMLDDREAILREKDASSAFVPNTLVEDRMTLRRGERTVEISFLGRANSPGDLVVYLGAQRILIGGDIVTYPVPFGYPKYPTELVASIDRLLDFDFDRLVPGHGPVLEGKAYARKVRDLVARTNARVAELVEKGLDLETVRDRLDFSSERRLFAGDDDSIGYFFDTWYAEPVVERTYNELTGKTR